MIEPIAPDGTVMVPVPALCDPDTLEPLTKEQAVARFGRAWRQEHPDTWPSVARVKAQFAGVIDLGTGTIHRGLALAGKPKGAPPKRRSA